MHLNSKIHDFAAVGERYGLLKVSTMVFGVPQLSACWSITDGNVVEHETRDQRDLFCRVRLTSPWSPHQPDLFAPSFVRILNDMTKLAHYFWYTTPRDSKHRRAYHQIAYRYRQLFWESEKKLTVRRESTPNWCFGKTLFVAHLGLVPAINPRDP